VVYKCIIIYFIHEVSGQLSENLPDGVTAFAKNMAMAIKRTSGNWNEETELILGMWTYTKLRTVIIMPKVQIFPILGP